MELNDLENIAEREKIGLINYKMRKVKARIINQPSTFIFMDYSKINTYTEEKCLLAEELGHYFYDGYYNLSSSQIMIDKADYKSLKWRSLVCVPLKSILDCFKNRDI